MERCAIDCSGANLYAHDHAVAIDKTGDLWNVGNNNFKVIPFTAIVAIHAKLESTIIKGYIEFETANRLLSIGSDKTERTRENGVTLSGTNERDAEAKEALQYIFDEICNR
ncbi:hypothetical protein [uncultured Acidaminococcus sp.]|jgi:low affinity Fe/Cu permease|uniref:hypothetical protein n=1 Tax=uncultured Acidaminococcus sp. TaxID=352152 RepID=UPI0025F5CC9F|nr:hypothetical protein [uncultured Acidaminococcus sp.]